MFPGIFSTYFPWPFLPRPSAPITTGTVSIILLLVIILLLLLLLLFHFTLITTSTILQKSLPGGLFISSTFGGGREGLNRGGGSLFERRA